MSQEQILRFLAQALTFNVLHVELSWISLVNNIGGKGWLYILEAIFFLLVWVSLTILEKNRSRIFSYFVYGIIVFSVMRAIIFTLLLYLFWSQSIPGKYFLPPYQPISYFIHYIFTHFYFSFLLALLTTGGISLIFLILKKYRKDAFQSGDIALYILCCMIIRWPLLLPYTFVVLAIAALFVIVNGYIIKGRREIFLYPFFLVTAIPFIFFGNVMIYIFHLQSLLLPL